jgi:hypothetical protein
MKKAITFLYLFTILVSIKGQSYIPMLKEGNQWNIYRDISNPMHYTEIYKVDIDTVINSHICKKIVETIDSSISATYIFYCFMFEDTISKKVFAIDNQNNTNLYFDFNAQLGDTLILFSPAYNTTDTFKVSQVNTLDVNNITRKKITLDYFSTNSHLQNVDSWIEGVGSLKGLVYGNVSPLLVGSQYSLLCFSNHNQILYQDPNSTFCYSTNLKIDEDHRNPIKIFPNPVLSKTTITFNTPENSSVIYIYDMLGKLVFEKTHLGNSNTEEIDLSVFPKGLYCMIIKADNGIFQKTKLIKL